MNGTREWVRFRLLQHACQQGLDWPEWTSCPNSTCTCPGIRIYCKNVLHVQAYFFSRIRSRCLAIKNLQATVMQLCDEFDACICMAASGPLHASSLCDVISVLYVLYRKNVWCHLTASVKHQLHGRTHPENTHAHVKASRTHKQHANRLVPSRSRCRSRSRSDLI